LGKLPVVRLDCGVWFIKLLLHENSNEKAAAMNMYLEGVLAIIKIYLRNL
jgi:hypothetical protein